MPRSSRFAASLMLLLAAIPIVLLLIVAAAQAQEQGTRALDQVRQGLDRINADLKTENIDGTGFREIGARIPPLRDRAQAVIDELRPQLTGIDERLAQIGAPPEEGQPPEGPEVTAEREEQTKLRQSIDEVMRRARLLEVEADQIADNIRQRERDLFFGRVLIRGPSILSPTLWQAAAAETPRYVAAVKDVFDEFVEIAGRNFDPGAGALIALALVGAILIGGPLRLWVQARARKLAVEQVPGSRLRRSGHALMGVVLAAAIPAIVASIVYFALTGTDSIPDRLAPFVRAVLILYVFVAFVGGLGHAILAWNRPSWRLPAISDEVSDRLRPYPLLIASIVAIWGIFYNLNELIVAGIAITIVVSAAGALLIVGTWALALRAARRGQREAEEAGRPGEDDWVFGLVRLVVWGVILIVIASLLAGYASFALFLANQIVWLALIGTVLYLLMTLVDDLLGDEAVAASPVARFAEEVVGLKPATFLQLCVLLSGIIRLALIFLGVLLALAPWGFQSDDAASWVRRVFTGFELAGFAISPSTILSAFAILAIGMIATRVIQGWLSRRYLPHTRMDDGLKNSISTAVGYAGIILAGGFALTTLGIGLDRLAIVAGALSVGIGFGLQSIVSNFVSGLILLAERPIRVGDWIRLGADQGNVRRIAVRSTIIEMFDRSTLIVPNSDLITKPVRNFTHQNPLGRVRINLGVAHDADVEQIRGILLAAARGHKSVIETPAPSVTIIGITETGIGFSLFCFVSSQRHVSDTSSDLYFAVLTQLQEAGVKVVAPPAI